MSKLLLAKPDPDQMRDLAAGHQPRTPDASPQQVCSSPFVNIAAIFVVNKGLKIIKTLIVGNLTSVGRPGPGRQGGQGLTALPKPFK